MADVRPTNARERRVATGTYGALNTACQLRAGYKGAYLSMGATEPAGRDSRERPAQNAPRGSDPAGAGPVEPGRPRHLPADARSHSPKRMRSQRHCRSGWKPRAFSTTTNAQADARRRYLAVGVATLTQTSAGEKYNQHAGVTAPAVVPISTAAPTRDRRARGTRRAADSPFLRPERLASRLIPPSGFFCAWVLLVFMPPFFARATGNERDQLIPEVPNA